MKALPEGTERRLVLRLLNYWRDKGDGDKFPALADMDAVEIPDMWPFCFVIGVSGDEDTRFTYVGDQVVFDVPGLLPSTTLSALPECSLVRHATAYVDQVLRRKVPVTKGGEFAAENGATIQFRSILLPLGEDGRTIDYLFGAANCREMPRE